MGEASGGDRRSHKSTGTDRQVRAYKSAEIYKEYAKAVAVVMPKELYESIRSRQTGAGEERPRETPEEVDCFSFDVNINKCFPEVLLSPERVEMGTAFHVGAGLFATAHHVVRGRDSVLITALGDVLEASTVAEEPEYDVAIVKPEDTDLVKSLPKFELGSAVTVEPGEEVVVLGFPLGEMGSTRMPGVDPDVAFGVVRGVGKVAWFGEVAADGFIKLDIYTAPGNSGGPVVALEGQNAGKAIGLISFGLLGGHGIYYASPIDVVKAMLDVLQRLRQYRPVKLGLAVRPLNPFIAQCLGLRQQKGLYVLDVRTSLPVEVMGDRSFKTYLGRGYVITEVGGQPVNSYLELKVRAVEAYLQDKPLNVEGFTADGKPYRGQWNFGAGEEEGGVG